MIADLHCNEDAIGGAHCDDAIVFEAPVHCHEDVIAHAGGNRQSDGDRNSRKVNGANPVLLAVVQVNVQILSVGGGVAAVLQIMIGELRDG